MQGSDKVPLKWLRFGVGQSRREEVHSSPQAMHSALINRNEVKANRRSFFMEQHTKWHLYWKTQRKQRSCCPVSC